MGRPHARELAVTSQFVVLEVSHQGQVATLTLQRPPANVMSLEMTEEINSALLGLRDARDLKVLVVRGSGDVFSRGIDLAEHSRERVTRLVQVFHRIFETIRLLNVVSVAAVNGAAAAGGFALALGCNLVVAKRSAVFSLPEVRTGLFPPVPCVILPRAAPRRKAMEWILLGEEISADELASFGLVNRVFPDDGFEQGLQQMVERLIANSGPVLQLARRAQTESYYATYEEALFKVENLYLRDLLALQDPHAGIQAALDGREAQWRNA
jgi:enoyl-CoA hydratase/carnithine racemase